MACTGMTYVVMAQISGQCPGSITGKDLCEKALKAVRAEGKLDGKWLKEGKASMNSQRVVIGWGRKECTRHYCPRQ